MDQKEQSNTEYWKQIIDKAEASPFSVSEWCRQNGIRPRKFYYWRKRLKEISQSMAGAELVQVPESPFIEFSIENEPLPNLHSEALKASNAVQKTGIPSLATEPEIRIEVSSFKVFVKNGVKEQTLRMVLRVISDA